MNEQLKICLYELEDKREEDKREDAIYMLHRALAWVWDSCW